MKYRCKVERKQLNNRFHGAAISVDAVEETFKSKVDYRTHTPKMADVWPIENVWAIGKSCTNKVHKRTAATESHCSSLDQVKALCQGLMTSLPFRLQAVIKKNGSQIQKEDYQTSL